MTPQMPMAPVELIRRELGFPTQVDTFHLVGAAQTATKPARAAWALILTSALVYANGTGVAAVPVATLVDGTGSFPVQPQYGIFLNVRSITSFSLFGTAETAVCWYSDQSVFT